MIESMLAREHGKKTSPLRFLSGEDFGKRHAVPGYWRPNLARSCRRRQVYKACGCKPEAPKFSLEQELTFQRGHLLGELVNCYFRAMVGYEIDEVQFERVVYDRVVEIGGKYDIKFRIGLHWYVLENKSKENPIGWLQIQAPEKDHFAQLNDYMAMDGTYQGGLLYVGLAPATTGKSYVLDFKFYFKRFDPKTWSETRTLFSTLDLFRSAQNRLPPRNPKYYGEKKECDNCPYQGPCSQELSPERAKALYGTI